MNNFPINNNFYKPIGQINNQSPNNQPMPQNLEPQILNQNIKIENPMIFNLEMAQMDSAQVLKYLQNLLKLPQNIEEFVNELNSGVNAKLAKVIVENMISTKALGEFLNQNSKEAIETLLKTISTSLKSGITDVSQLKEILGVLSTMQNNTNINTIKELLLLYIPLHIPVFDKDMEFNGVNGEQEEKIKNSTLSVMFETNNLSNILCCLNQEYNNLFMDIYAPDFFPYERFIKIISTLASAINCNIDSDFHKIKNENSKKSQNFKIISQGFIPTDTLILSHIIIKTVFKIDNDFT